MSANPHWNAPPPTYDSHLPPTFTPYLQLSHLLSLTWLAYPILSLLFVAFRLQLSLASAEDGVASVKNDLLASCKAAETAATSAASMPRYMAVATNEQFADIVNGSLNAARSSLVLALTVMEVIINFIIDLYRSTFLCFLELVVRGGLSILISAVDELNNLVQSAASGIQSSIQNDIQSANSAIQSAINTINKINPLGKVPAPQIPVPDLSGLTNLSLPSSFQDALTTLNNSIPSVADLKDEVESIIDQPFELTKKEINDTFASISFNSSSLPVPQQNFLTFCDQVDLSVVDNVGHDLITTATIGTIILILLALALVGLNCLLEWYKWRCMKQHLEYTRQAWNSDPTMPHTELSAPTSVSLTNHNLMILIISSLHPLLTRIANTLSKRLRLSPMQHTRLQWFFNYVFHPPALACFLIGFFGILSVEIQLLALGPLVAKYQEQSANTASDFSNVIFNAINSSMYNQSASYANDVNSRVDAVQTTINDGLFGWVNVTTVTLNTTIATFYNDIQSAVNTIFNGTILQSPAQEFIQCFIGTKVDAVENALTFLHDNLVINMPRVNHSVLVLSPDYVNEATRPIAAAAIGGGDDGNGGLIMKLVNSYAESLKKERLLFGIFLALWGLVVLMAICFLLWHSRSKALVEKRRQRKWEREQRSGEGGFMNSPLKQEKGPSSVHNNPRTFKHIFSRNASPASSEINVGDTSRSSGDDEEQETTNWATSFKERFVLPVRKLKAMAIRKSPREHLMDDQAGPSSASPSYGVVKESTNKENIPLLGRMIPILDKKQPEFQAPAIPKIRFLFERPSKDTGIDLSPSPPSPADPASSPSTSSKILTRKKPFQPPTELPARPSEPDAPIDADSAQDEAFLAEPLVRTPFAPPLHHGFDDSPYNKLNPAPNPSLLSAPKSILKSPQKFRPPVPARHQRTSSVTARPTLPSNASASIILAKMPTAMHARKSSSVDPFVTPFDDEYRVTIAHPTHTRRSITTFIAPV